MIRWFVYIDKTKLPLLINRYTLGLLSDCSDLLLCIIVYIDILKQTLLIDLCYYSNKLLST